MADTMQDLLGATTARIEELAPLVEEYQRLREVEAVLRAQIEGKPTGRASGRPLHIGGDRARQIVALVREEPGIRVKEIAERLGIGDTGVYRIARALADDGQIRREGKGYVPVDSAG